MNKALKTDSSDKIAVSTKPESGAAPLAAVSIKECKINDHCIGDHWTVGDFELLARLIAIVAMGQVKHAAQIIRALQPAVPVLTLDVLRADAKQRLSVTGDTHQKQDAHRWIRDGLIFEVISWIAARQGAAPKVLMRDPHISATTQGLDGLMVELDEKGEKIVRVTIFEDKCSNDPRRKFQKEVLPAFRNYHAGKRASELVAATSSLLDGRIPDEAVTEAAGRVLAMEFRAYRAGLTISPEHDSEAGRTALFKGYDDLDKITGAQRIGATFLPPTELRAWFDKLANRTIAFIDEIGKDDH
ncbi:hypothetical protein [Azospirillum aestuarii]|uniref:hypothetical protein n=1 Tax=Azospirillum aestuarii TaxID=2802052 RepID=UPI004054C446